MSSAVDRYRAALQSGDRAVLDAWAATGAEGVELLRRELRRPTIQPATGGHDREVLDHLTGLIAAIAEAAPDAFLAAFTDDEWRHNGLVAIGYGRIDDPEATRRLVVALESDAWPTRVDAVMGLGRRADPRATAALIEAVDDPEYLVRYHAFCSLRAIGDETALRVLARPAWPTVYEAELARAARDAIEGRRAGR